MKTFYSNDFTGHYPVGTAAIVMAKDIKEAEMILSDKLTDRGLIFDGTLTELKSNECIILNDGNY